MTKQEIKNYLVIRTISCLFIFLGLAGFAQSSETVSINSGSVFKNLKIFDSLVFYQCHVESGTQQLSTASGQTITGASKKYTITEKYILIKVEEGYQVKYFISALNIFPNKKFAGLKFKEKFYWEFQQKKNFALKEIDIRAFLAMEEKGKDAIVYDYGITKYNTNQIIIRYSNDYKQLVIDGPYVISKLINVNER